MRRFNEPWAAFASFGLSLLLLPSPAKSYQLQTQFRSESSLIPKQLWFPSSQPSQDGSAETIAKSYLSAQSQLFGISSELKEIKLIETRSSLLGQHLVYQQMQGSTPIDDAYIVVSVLNDGRIFQVYNTLIPQTNTLTTMQIKLSKDQAYDAAWQHLGVSGELYEEPKAKLYFKVIQGSLRPSFRVELSVLQPYGAWVIWVDATTGAILSSEDQRISHKPRVKSDSRSKVSEARLNRAQAFLKFYQKQTKKLMAESTPKPGKAKVFDPDPRTALLDESLEDTSPAQSFKTAYFERILPDLAYDGQRFKLEGPWVKIIDFDPPNTLPSTSSDGNWFFERGDNRFNDAMTYYHIDKSQRYMQSLGFKGASGIQYGPIEADTDGVNGDDNSYFQPSSNRLSFGHGCVDDNEDSDVILHEYGHAIHFSINPRWSGGDTGAMGEGFGDYWAASYSLSTANGKDYFPNQVYSWDGHGTSDSCWPGRILDALEARYDPTRVYGAHSTIPGGFQSDELWSTPLFQSLLTLLEQGVPREEVDTIVLQAQFGLGTQIKMREMAQAILATARQLFPDGPHAKVFKSNFLRHGIIEEPRPIFEASIAELSDSGGDGILDPGEDVELKISLKNKGTLDAKEITLSVTSSEAKLSFLAGTSVYAPIAIGGSALNETPIRFKLAGDAACGLLVPLQFKITFQDGATTTLNAQLRVGRAVGIMKSIQQVIAIPDGNATGISVPLLVDSAGPVSDQLKVQVQIKHPYKGDLRVSVQSPSGKTVVLHDRGGFGDDDIRGIYPTTLPPKEPLSKLLGEERAGTWKLLVQDVASVDAGSFEAWGIEDISRYTCQ